MARWSRRLGDRRRGRQRRSSAGVVPERPLWPGHRLDLRARQARNRRRLATDIGSANLNDVITKAVLGRRAAFAAGPAFSGVTMAERGATISAYPRRRGPSASIQVQGPRRSLPARLAAGRRGPATEATPGRVQEALTCPRTLDHQRLSTAAAASEFDGEEVDCGSDQDDLGDVDHGRESVRDTGDRGAASA